MGLLKNIKSPGCSCEREIFRPYLNCARDECGIETPADAKARIVKPEQSHVCIPAAPKTYRSPIWARAYLMALPERPLTPLYDLAALFELA